MPAVPHILVVDDEPTITEFVSYALSSENYLVDVAGSGEEALELIEGQSYNLFILDIVMPGIDGFELCRRIRQTDNTPILFLSSRDGEMDKVQGLELGADDYLTKPFGMRELIARVRALLRRFEGAATPQNGPIKVAGIVLDKTAHTAKFNGEEIELTPREFELLACLMESAGTVVHREDLLRQAWGWEYLTQTKTVDTHIKRLRAKLEACGADPKLVETVRGYGYRIQL